MNNLMKIIVGPRQSGKSTDLIKRAAAEWLYIVCMHHEDARRLADKARSMCLDIPFPISFAEFLGGRFSGKGINGFIVDNVELLIGQIARGVPVTAISMNGSSENIELYNEKHGSTAALTGFSTNDKLNAIRSALGDGADESLWPPGLTEAEAVSRLIKITAIETGMAQLHGWTYDYGCWTSDAVVKDNDGVRTVTVANVEKNINGGWNLWIDVDKYKPDHCHSNSDKTEYQIPTALEAIEKAEEILAVIVGDG